MKKILFITYYWPPAGGAGVQRPLKFAKYFPDFSIEPVILTVDEKYASYPLSDPSLLKDIAPSLFVVKTKSMEPLKVLSFFTGKKSIPHGGFSNSNKEKFTQKLLRFLRGNLFIPDARIGWIRYALKSAEALILKEKIDTVLISSPPHSSQLIGMQLKKKFNIRWIADMRDPWTDIYYYKDLLHTSISARKDARLEKLVLENADEIIVVSNPIRDLFLKKSTQIQPDKFHIIPNGFDENDFLLKPGTDNSEFIFTYVGTIADSYKPEALFKSIKKAIAEFNNISFKIRLVGSLPESLKLLIKKLELETYTEYISYVNHEAAVNYMQQSSALLLLIPDMPGNEGILTGKIFEYLAARKPILGLGPIKGDASAILRECKAGKMFERSEGEELFKEIKSLILQWKENPTYFNSSDIYLKYSRKELTRKISKIILKEN